MGNLKYLGVALGNKYWRMKKLRGNELEKCTLQLLNVLLSFLLSEN
jgi:hypothetical protein